MKGVSIPVIKERIFYIEWSHECDKGAHMNAILTFENVEQLFDFFAYEEDPITFFAFQDITNESIEDFERKLNYHGKYSL